jgi:uncharacterized protein (DUF58 family)
MRACRLPQAESRGQGLDGRKRRPRVVFTRLIEAWSLGRRPRCAGDQISGQRIYILPTAYGYLYALMLMVMWLWSVNYNNSMGFALTFLLGAVALNAMWRTHGNLLGLRVGCLGADPVFLGQQARFAFRVENPDEQFRLGIALQAGNLPPQYGDIPPHGAGFFDLNLSAARRGLLRLPRVCLLTRFPLGLFQAWSWFDFDHTCLIYPRPLR